MLRGTDGSRNDTLRLTPPPPGAPRRTPIGDGWRHEFDIVLTTDGESLVVRDGRGARRTFSPVDRRARAGEREGATRFVGEAAEDGEIRIDGARHVWLRGRGRGSVAFVGSLPVRVVDADGIASTLRYDGGRLVDVVDGSRRRLRFAYDRDRLATIRFADGTVHALERRADGALSTRARSPALECSPDDEHAPHTPPAPSGPSGPPGPPGPPGSPSSPAHEPEPDTETPCDVDATPPGPAFADGPGLPGAVRLDARPASCRSYFVDYHGTERGAAIERGLAGLPHYAGSTPTVRSFPVVDFVGAELRVVRSRDLAAPTYDGPGDALFERLLRDGKDIARHLLEPLARDGRLSVSEGGETTTILHRPERPIVLELVVRHGLASARQRDQIRRARRALAARHGVVLRVIEIP